MDLFTTITNEIFTCLINEEDPANNPLVRIAEKYNIDPVGEDMMMRALSLAVEWYENPRIRVLTEENDRLLTTKAFIGIIQKYGAIPGKDFSIDDRGRIKVSLELKAKMLDDLEGDESLYFEE